jgi:phage protein D
MAAECRLHIVLRPGLPTDWRITKAEHRLSNSGYTTQADAEIFLQQQEKVT